MGSLAENTKQKILTSFPGVFVSVAFFFIREGLPVIPGNIEIIESRSNLFNFAPLFESEPCVSANSGDEYLRNNKYKNYKGSVFI